MTAGRTLNTLSQEWGTPEKYVKAVRQVFDGRIDLDPCSNEYSIVDAMTEYRLPEFDGLREPWDFPTIYVNPPYGIDKERSTSIKHWLSKCSMAHADYDAAVLALVPVATNTGHWKRFVFGNACGICFLYDTRLKFLVNGEDGGKGAPMSCAMIYWGRDYQRFFSVFQPFGAVVDLRPQHGQSFGPLHSNGQRELVFQAKGRENDAAER
ncbi:MAG: N-6 DNA methylase [Planctomycetia bacterium]|nr:N-6 DNA methylase [Planctomycetia bacterium]